MRRRLLPALTTVVALRATTAAVASDTEQALRAERATGLASRRAAAPANQ
jgi:hypothetical protein